MTSWTWRRSVLALVLLSYTVWFGAAAVRGLLGMARGTPRSGAEGLEPLIPLLIAGLAGVGLVRVIRDTHPALLIGWPLVALAFVIEVADLLSLLISRVAAEGAFGVTVRWLAGAGFLTLALLILWAAGRVLEPTRPRGLPHQAPVP